MNIDYSKMTDEDFDRILIHKVLKDMKVVSIIDLPGIYEILREEYNNEVLEHWGIEQEETEVEN